MIPGGRIPCNAVNRKRVWNTGFGSNFEPSEGRGQIFGKSYKSVIDDMNTNRLLEFSAIHALAIGNVRK